MTRRERILGLIFLGTLVAAACLFGSQLYLARLQRLDAQIAKAEARKVRLELSIQNAISGEAPRRAWTVAESSPDAFLSSLDRITRSAGWSIESTTFKGRKDGYARFSISVEGPSGGWERLLSAMDSWDRPVLIESLEALASGKGRMRARIEAGYEAR